MVQEAHAERHVFRAAADARGGNEGQERPAGLGLGLFGVDLAQSGHDRLRGGSAELWLINGEDLAGMKKVELPGGSRAEARDDDRWKAGRRRGCQGLLHRRDIEGVALQDGELRVEHRFVEALGRQLLAQLLGRPYESGRLVACFESMHECDIRDSASCAEKGDSWSGGGGRGGCGRHVR